MGTGDGHGLGTGLNDNRRNSSKLAGSLSLVAPTFGDGKLPGTSRF